MCGDLGGGLERAWTSTVGDPKKLKLRDGFTLDSAAQLRANKHGEAMDFLNAVTDEAKAMTIEQRRARARDLEFEGLQGYSDESVGEWVKKERQSRASQAAADAETAKQDAAKAAIARLPDAADAKLRSMDEAELLRIRASGGRKASFLTQPMGSLLAGY